MIDAYQHTGATVTFTFGVENKGDARQTVSIGTFYLVDGNGDRWNGQSENGYGNDHLDVAPGMRRRIPWSFKPETAASGSIFTLTDGSANVLLRDLR